MGADRVKWKADFYEGENDTLQGRNLLILERTFLRAFPEIFWMWGQEW